jgi:hypothetical protein
MTGAEAVRKCGMMRRKSGKAGKRKLNVGLARGRGPPGFAMRIPFQNAGYLPVPTMSLLNGALLFGSVMPTEMPAVRAWGTETGHGLNLMFVMALILERFNNYCSRRFPLILTFSPKGGEGITERLAMTNRSKRLRFFGKCYRSNWQAINDIKPIIVKI